MATEGMTAADATHCQPEASGHPVQFHRLHGVGRTRRQIATAGRAQTRVLLIPTEQCPHRPFHEPSHDQGRGRSGPAGPNGIVCNSSQDLEEDMGRSAVGRRKLRDEREQVVSKVIEGHRCGLGAADTDEVQARLQLVRAGQDGSKTSANAVAHHGRPHRSTDRIPNIRGATVVGWERSPAQPAIPSGAAATVAGQRIKRRPGTKRLDQADNFLRPWRRRLATIRRPALVDMRWRNPWRLARRRTFG